MQPYKDKAQAATELAVFGAMLIFVIGSIIRTSIQAGMDQDQSLKAMRWALSQSLQGVRTENKSRDSANLLVIEDRLSPDATKFGSLERTPMVQAGSGTFSNTIFMPLDWGEDRNISIMDVFINGQHFAFTAARFITYDVQLKPGDPGQIRVWDLTNKIIKYVPVREGANWISNCLPGPVGCPIFFTIVPENSADFCKDEATCDNSVAPFDQRWDLNLNFIYTDDPQGAVRDNMMWQWKPIKGLKDNIKINTDDGVYVAYDIDYDRKEETIYRVNSTPGFNEPPINNLQVVQRIGVLDSQKGDINLNVDDTDKLGVGSYMPMDMGLQKEVSVYTLTNNGTYLQIRQGKAYNPETGNFVRSVSKKDQVDVISRMFQLSNDTGRYCTGVGSVRSPTGPIVDPIGGGSQSGLANPVEYCVNSKLQSSDNCFTSSTVSATCFDKGTLMMYIRSRIQDQRGRKWVTQLE